METMTDPIRLTDEPKYPEHQPTLMRSSFGCWATCLCGWKSAYYPHVMSAHTEFGLHLLATDDRTDER